MTYLKNNPKGVYIYNYSAGKCIFYIDPEQANYQGFEEKATKIWASVLRLLDDIMKDGQRVSLRAPPLTWRVDRNSQFNDRGMAKLTVDAVSTALAGLDEASKLKLQRSAHIKFSRRERVCLKKSAKNWRR